MVGRSVGLPWLVVLFVAQIWSGPNEAVHDQAPKFIGPRDRHAEGVNERGALRHLAKRHIDVNILALAPNALDVQIVAEESPTRCCIDSARRASLIRQDLDEVDVLQTSGPRNTAHNATESSRRDLSSCLLNAIVLGFQVTFTQPDQPTRESFAESIGIKVVPIKSGKYLMGSTKEQIDLIVNHAPELKRERFDAEQPQHRVKVTELEGLSAHEITVGQFRRFVEDTGYKTEAERDGTGGYGFDAVNDWTQDPKFTWRNPGWHQEDNYPVVVVSWNDAVEFCRWLSRKDGRVFRLPLEAEWEYACRAGSTTLYPNGDDPKRLCRIANVADLALRKQFPDFEYRTIPADDGVVFTGPVGRYEPNAWGLYDMIGNAWEWCFDECDLNYYSTLPDSIVNPKGPLRPARNAHPVIRGGSWRDGDGGYTRSAVRGRYPVNGRAGHLGFRVVRVWQEKK